MSLNPLKASYVMVHVQDQHHRKKQLEVETYTLK